MSTPDFVYKVAPRALHDASLAAGRFIGAPIDEKDGFIHLSTASQLAETLRLYFAGQSDLVVFSIRCADFGDTLKWELSRGGALFPHLYGELPMTRIGNSATIAVASDGAVTLPAWVK